MRDEFHDFYKRLVEIVLLREAQRGQMSRMGPRGGAARGPETRGQPSVKTRQT